MGSIPTHSRQGRDYVAFFGEARFLARYSLPDMTTTFVGRHYETGALTNVLAAMGAQDPKTGKPFSEALALGASGGIAFGYFVFEYKGHLPHMALLGRNTFSPFERMLDNMAIRREPRETVKADRAEQNLRLELDSGNIPFVWADIYSMPYRGLRREEMWAVNPIPVLGYEGNDFFILDGASVPIRVSGEVLSEARGRIKKDRYRMMTIEPPDESRLAEGIRRGIETCLALFLDKPPAGSANNFGVAGMRHFAKMLVDAKNAKGWTRTFQPGPRLVQALAGRHGQPGVWDWIEGWSTGGGANRRAYAQFLREASAWLAEPQWAVIAERFDETADLWRLLAESAMPDEVEEFKELKALKRRMNEVWFEQGTASNEERAEIRARMADLTEKVGEEGRLDAFAVPIQSRMAEIVDEIVPVEEKALQEMRVLLSAPIK